MSDTTTPREAAINALGENIVLPQDIDPPDPSPEDYDRMDEVASTNSPSGTTRAFSGGLPEGWSSPQTDELNEDESLEL